MARNRRGVKSLSEWSEVSKAGGAATLALAGP
jgi:hypothetical protein